MNQTLARRFPRLLRLFSAYLNEDWDQTFPSAEAAVAAFRKDAKAKERREAAAELAALSAEFPDESSLDDALGGLLCGYLPSAHGTTARRWVEHLRSLFEKTTKA